MFLYNQYMEVSGIIRFEKEQILTSGLKTYNSPTFILEEAWFCVADRRKKVVMGKQSNREHVEEITAQFGHKQIKNLLDTGISFIEGRMQLQYDGHDYRATDINTFGIPYSREYIPVGLIEVTFRRKVAYVD